MAFEIKEISAERNIGLSQEGKPVDPTQPIWPLNWLLRLRKRLYVRKISGTNHPAAFSINAGTPAQLKVTLGFDDEIASCRGKLDAYYNEKILFSSRNVEWKSGEKIAVFEVYAKGQPERFCRFSGELTWKVSWTNDTGDKVDFEVGKTYLELFWLHDFVNKLFTKGVPVEILRQIAYALKITEESATNIIISGSDTNGTINPSMDPVIEAVVESCFFRNPPAYDIYDNNDYFLMGTNPEKPMAFLLHQYLNSIHDPTALCNCFDMAAAVQIFLKAVGIEKVKFCYMEPFGYIRLTGLVGRGLSNNPFHSQKVHYNRESELIVDETKSSRVKFSSHTFCCLPDDCFFPQGMANRPNNCVDWNYCQYNCRNCRILDACIGPHIGKENNESYIKNAIDDVSPPEVPNEPPGILQVNNGITHIDWCPDIENEPNSSRVIALKNEIGYPREEVSDAEYYVVCPWPDPRSCHVLDKEWDIFFEKIIPGDHTTLKTWKLRKKGASIQIDIYVASPSDKLAACKAAQYRLLELGSGSLLPKSPYKKGPSYLGQYSVKSTGKDFGKHFWTLYNVIFYVTCRNATCNIGALHVWLNELAVNHREKSIDEYLPSLADIKKRIKQQIGKTAVVETNSPKNVFIDFVFRDSENIGIQLIEQTDKRLKFYCFRKSTNIITIAVVDKDTLVTSSKDITIEVKA